ncbi:hypothetical protein MKX01_036550 [Papaver californicum]|nr:hypothetical protein MKX01_036550 [Papaver californicum]
MIKRQFYKQDHDNDKDDISDSSSDSESEEELSEAQEEDEDSDAVAEANEDEQPSLLPTGSGYNSEESSEDEVVLTHQVGFRNYLVFSKDNIKDSQSMSKRSATKDPIHAVFAMRTLKCKSVFKCRLCPRIVCLSEETMKAHLTSKRHARSEKLLTEGRLKFMLNSDGEAEEEPETHAERHARTLAIAQNLKSTSKKKNGGRQRQRNRKKKKKKKEVKKDQLVKKQDKEKEKQSVKKQAKKRRKHKD